MKNIFAYQSSDVDWCEGNFERSEYIAEYYNTVSNLGYILVAPILVWLNQSYIRYRPIPMPGFAVMMVMVGVFSAYFHTTLSYAGQLLDELSILWTLAAGYTWWLPQPYFPAYIKNRKQFTWLIFFVTLGCTIMSFVKPVLNAYVLNCMAGHVLYMVVRELRMFKDPKLNRHAIKAITWWMIGISCWLVDNFFCNFCQKINFCYMHSLWHVFTAVALVCIVPLFSCFDVLRAAPSMDPQIAYWPSGNSPMKLPYITLQDPQKWH